MEGTMNRRLMNGVRRTLGLTAKVLGALALVVLVVDGVLSVALGTRWLEMQRTHTPPWYARVAAALQRLPDPAFRAIGGLQAAASGFGLLRLK